MMVRRFPLVACFVLAYALTWWVYPLLRFSPLLGLFGLFGPALAAIIVTGITDGRAGVKALLGRTVRWRVPLRWYLVALGVPAALALMAAGLYVLVGPGTSITLGRLSALDFVLVILVVGEELGWRGYALPKLLEKRSPLTASLIMGVLWWAWHLPTFFIPGTPQFRQPIVAFLVLTTAYSILLSWLFLHTVGSVLLPTLCHGAINVFQGFFLAGVDPASRYWWLALSYGTAALVLTAVLGPWDSRHRSSARIGPRQYEEA
jgi:membrane protease YdiL (CAAX protease family)